MIFPVEGGQVTSNMPLCDRIASLVDRREEQRGFLDVRGEQQEVYDLCYPGPADVGEVGRGVCPDSRVCRWKRGEEKLRGYAFPNWNLGMRVQLPRGLGGWGGGGFGF